MSFGRPGARIAGLEKSAEWCLLQKTVPMTYLRSPRRNRSRLTASSTPQTHRMTCAADAANPYLREIGSAPTLTSPKHGTQSTSQSHNISLSLRSFAWIVDYWQQTGALLFMAVQSPNTRSTATDSAKCWQGSSVQPTARLNPCFATGQF
jgi:hypothetical protein